jgi:hypothetical protein
VFEYGVRYLFIGKSGAILLGFPDTTQDADLFPAKSEANGKALVAALSELKFELTDAESAAIIRGKDFVQLRNGPFDLDLVFAPDGIETFEGPKGKAAPITGGTITVSSTAGFSASQGRSLMRPPRERSRGSPAR